MQALACGAPSRSRSGEGPGLPKRARFSSSSSIFPQLGCGGGWRLPALRCRFSPPVLPPVVPRSREEAPCVRSSSRARGRASSVPGGEGEAGVELSRVAFGKSCCAQTLLYVTQELSLGSLLYSGAGFQWFFSIPRTDQYQCTLQELLIPRPQEVRALNFSLLPPPLFFESKCAIVESG